jgi:peptide/nickel transport system permease protein
VVAERLPNSLELAGLGFVLMLAIGIPAGVLAALHRGRTLDRPAVTGAVLGHSLPPLCATPIPRRWEMR